MNAPAEPLLFDFAPHAVEHVGSFDGRWFVSLVQYPLLLALDDAGQIVDRFPLPDVKAVINGKIAVRQRIPHAQPANVQRELDFASLRETAYDLATGLEIASGDEAVSALVAGAPARVNVDPSRFVARGATAILRLPPGASLEGPLTARVVPVASSLDDFPLEPGKVFFVGPERVLVDHGPRGRFWFELPESGLTKGDDVALGGFFSTPGGTIATVLVRDGRDLVRRPAPFTPALGETVTVGQAPMKPRKDVPAAVVLVADVLAEHGFIDRLSRADLVALFEECQPEDDDDAITQTTVADLLLGVYADTSGAARGVVHHDVRFGNETDDVVSELTAILGDEPIAFRQIGARSDALQIETCGRAHWVPFDRGGLNAIAHWLNAKLASAGARRRIFSVDTEADHWCYVICPPRVLEAMKARGLLGFGDP